MAISEPTSALQYPLGQEGPANEPVGGADQLHHPDLAPPGEDSHLDGHRDQQDGDDAQHSYGYEAHVTELLVDALELGDDRGGRLDLIDALLEGGLVADALGHYRHVLGVAGYHHEGGGQRVGLQV